ncbi:MAG: enoyl-CoA hydratase/isomerase family protein [Terriglobia bacterium]
MDSFTGHALSWKFDQGVCELVLHRDPCNEIGTVILAELEQFVDVIQHPDQAVRSLVIYSQLSSGFCAGADLRELYKGMTPLSAEARSQQVRDFLLRIHGVFNAIDALPITTIAAVHGVVFGGGLELALTCDLIVADRTARFCFPELRLGLIPGFGGIPRLKRDIGNGLVRDLLLTGRSVNADKAAAAGMVSQVVAPGESLRVARSVAAQATKFDPQAAQVTKEFVKPIPYAELQEEIRLFCELIGRPAVEQALRKFVESTDAQPYLP